MVFGKSELSGEINGLIFLAEVGEKHWRSQYLFSRDLAAESAERFALRYQLEIE